MCGAIEARGAEPVVTAVVKGVVTAGIADADLERFFSAGARKLSARDIGHAVAAKADGATTVAATMAIARTVGIDVFATGGIGGVHRDPRILDLKSSYDESADLVELSRTSMIVVCAGAKSILDLPATIERLETFGVTVIGYRTDDFPGFFTATTGLKVSARADSPTEIANAFLAGRAVGHPGAVLVVQPPPAGDALEPRVVEDAVERGLTRVRQDRVTGGHVTPILLSEVERATGGRSVRTNLALLENNAALAADIAVALASTI